MQKYGLVFIITGIVTGWLWLLRDELTLANFSLIYLMMVVLTAIYLGTQPSILAAFLSFAAFNFFLIDPVYTFKVADTRELVDLVIFLLIAILTGQLAAQVKMQSVQIHTQEETNQLKTALLHAVSHDFRTPITIIKSSADNLLTLHDMSQPEREETLKSIQQEADHLNRMIGNLLDMSRLEAGALQMSLELHSLEEVAGDVAAHTYQRLQVERIRLHFPTELPLVRFDYVLIRQVITNLVDNALRHARPNTFVVIRGSLHPYEVRLAVINQGENIPAELKPHLMEAFYRGEGGHTGLGLAIAYGMIDAHHGRIWLEDTPGGGATFIFSLPYTKEQTNANDSGRG